MASWAKSRNTIDTSVDRWEERKLHQEEIEEEDIAAKWMLEEEKLKREEDKKMKTSDATSLKEEAKMKDKE